MTRPGEICRRQESNPGCSFEADSFRRGPSRRWQECRECRRRRWRIWPEFNVQERSTDLMIKIVRNIIVRDFDRLREMCRKGPVRERGT